MGHYTIVYEQSLDQQLLIHLTSYDEYPNCFKFRSDNLNSHNIYLQIEQVLKSFGFEIIVSETKSQLGVFSEETSFRLRLSLGENIFEFTDNK